MARDHKSIKMTYLKVPCLSTFKALFGKGFSGRRIAKLMQFSV